MSDSNPLSLLRSNLEREFDISVAVAGSATSIATILEKEFENLSDEGRQKIIEELEKLNDSSKLLAETASSTGNIVHNILK